MAAHAWPHTDEARTAKLALMRQGVYEATGWTLVTIRVLQAILVLFSLFLIYLAVT